MFLDCYMTEPTPHRITIRCTRGWVALPWLLPRRVSGLRAPDRCSVLCRGEAALAVPQQGGRHSYQVAVNRGGEMRKPEIMVQYALLPDISGLGALPHWLASNKGWWCSLEALDARWRHMARLDINLSHDSLQPHLCWPMITMLFTDPELAGGVANTNCHHEMVRKMNSQYRFGWDKSTVRCAKALKPLILFYMPPCLGHSYTDIRRDRGRQRLRELGLETGNINSERDKCQSKKRRCIHLYVQDVP